MLVPCATTDALVSPPACDAEALLAAFNLAIVAWSTPSEANVAAACASPRSAIAILSAVERLPAPIAFSLSAPIDAAKFLPI